MSKLIVDLISLKNPVFETYVFWSGILILKMLFMSILTGFQRFKKTTVVNPEDLYLMEKYKSMMDVYKERLNKDKQLLLRSDDPDIERCRRAHRNDLENIIPFLMIGFLYLLTNPDATFAIILYRAGAMSRIAHTLVYAIFTTRQPARAILFFICFLVTVVMAIEVVKFTV